MAKSEFDVCNQVETVPHPQMGGLGRRDFLLSPHDACLYVLGLLWLFVPKIHGTPAVESAKNDNS